MRPAPVRAFDYGFGVAALGLDLAPRLADPLLEVGAKEIILELVDEHGPVWANIAETAALDEGISKKTVDAARKEMRLESKQGGGVSYRRNVRFTPKPTTTPFRVPALWACSGHPPPPA